MRQPVSSASRRTRSSAAGRPGPRARVPARRRPPDCARRRAARVPARATSRPAARAAPASARRPCRDGAWPRRSSTPQRSARASITASVTAALCAWCRPRSPSRSPSRRCEGVRASRKMPSHPVSRTVARYGWRGPARSSGTPRAVQRSRTGRSPWPVAPVTATLPALMIGAFSPPMAASVGPRIASWSCWTFVTAATPRSRTFVASSRPPSPTSTMARSTRRRASSAMAAAVSASNSVGGPTPSRRNPVDRREHPLDGRGERGRAQRLAVDRDSLAVADEVRLRHGADCQAGGAQNRLRHRHHGALAVRAADQRAAQPALGVAVLLQQTLDPLEAEADSEAPALGQGGDRLSVGEGQAVSPRRPRRRRSR